jgi:hypothetical protein
MRRSAETAVNTGLPRAATTEMEMSMPGKSSSDLASDGLVPPEMPRQSSMRRIVSKISTIGTSNGMRKRDFGFIPIPKRCRYDPSMKVEECFPWSLRKNLIFAICSVRP